MHGTISSKYHRKYWCRRSQIVLKLALRFAGEEFVLNKEKFLHFCGPFRCYYKTEFSFEI